MHLGDILPEIFCIAMLWVFVVLTCCIMHAFMLCSVLLLVCSLKAWHLYSAQEWDIACHCCVKLTQQ